MAVDAAVCSGCGSPRIEAATLDLGQGPASDALAALTAELRDKLSPDLQIIKPIGQGGMGSVFLARDPALKRLVAIKVLTPDMAGDPLAARRFEREAEAAAAVSHANVVNVHHVGRLPESGASYFVMQFVEGKSLADVMEEGEPMPEVRARRVVGEIASALGAAHAHGLVHRDIKPANVMMEATSDRAVVLDFGISAAVSEERQAMETKLTAAGVSVGTPEYMSPEQAAGGQVTDKSDVYSLGLLAFELLTGRPPFDEPSPMALVAAHINKTPPTVREVRPEIDSTTAALIDRCLSKTPEERPDAESVSRALLPARHVQIEWPPPGLEKLHRVGGRFIRMLTLFAVSASVVVVSGAGSAPWTIAVAGVVLASLGFIYYEIPLEDVFFKGWRSGYPLWTLIDVMFDPSKDTSNLVNGLGAFATLSPIERTRMLWRRRLSALTVLLGFLGTLAATVWLAVRPGRSADSSAFVEALLAIAPYVAGIVGALLLQRPERRLQPKSLSLGLSFSIKERIQPELVRNWKATAGIESLPPGRLVYSGARWFIVPAIELAVGAAVLIAVVVVVTPSVMLDADRVGGVDVEERALREATRALRTISSEFATPGGGPSVTDSLVSAVLVGSLSEHPEPDVLWAAWEVADALPDSLRETLERYRRSTALSAWSTLATGQVEPFWYAREGFSAQYDSAREQSERASHLARHTGVGLSAAALLSLVEGEDSAAHRYVDDLVRLGVQLTGDPGRNVHRAGLQVLIIAGRSVESLGEHLEDEALTETGRRLADTAEDRDESFVRLGYAWIAELADLQRGDSTRLGQWRSAQEDRERPPADRLLIANAVVEGLCWNRREVLSGPDAVRGEWLESADPLMSDVDSLGTGLEVLRARLRIMSGEEGSAAYRWGFCMGRRSALTPGG